MKRALVCGSTQGIGKAVAQQLLRDGCGVVLLARNEEKLKETVLELKSVGSGEVDYLVADFSQPEQLRQKLHRSADSLADIDILVNNTGGPKGGLIFEAKTEEFIAAFNQHLICNHILVQAVVPKMIERNWGRVINIISTSVKQPLPNLGVSNTIRGAVASWSKTLANELGQYNITVNNVLPGATDTERLRGIANNQKQLKDLSLEDIYEDMAKESPMKRIAQPEEIARAVAFLASENASYINGINLPVDGGRTKSL